MEVVEGNCIFKNDDLRIKSNGSQLKWFYFIKLGIWLIDNIYDQIWLLITFVANFASFVLEFEGKGHISTHLPLKLHSDCFMM